MTDQSELQDLLTQSDKLCAAATPGPWETNSVRTDDGRDHFIQAPTGVRVQGMGDVEFIAFARTALPSLVEEVRRLQIKLYQANGSISMLTGIPIERPS